MDISKYIAQKTFTAFNKSLIRNIIRISIINIALSLAVMIVAAATFEGFQKQIAQKVFGFWGHIHITNIQVNRSIEPIPLDDAGKYQRMIQDADFSSIGLDKSSIRDIEKFVILPGLVDHNNLFQGMFLKGVDPHFDWQYMEQFIKSGSIPQFEDSVFSRSILLSEQSAKKLDITTGGSLIAHFIINGNQIKRKLKVCGIYRTGLEEYDQKFALVDIRLLQGVLQWTPEQVTGLELFSNRLSDVEKINEFIYNEILPTEIYSETIRSKYPNIFEWLSLQDINKRFILGLILLVCIINMATTLLILILERTHMIGILSTLGLGQWNQRKIFIRYGVKLLVKGMLYGNIIGLGLCFIQWKWKFIKLSEADYYLDHAPISFNPTLLIFLNLVFFITITISLLVPSYFVSKIRPVNALKFRA